MTSDRRRSLFLADCLGEQGLAESHLLERRVIGIPIAFHIPE